MKVFVSNSEQEPALTYVTRFIIRLEEAISSIVGDKSDIHVLNDGFLREGFDWKLKLTNMPMNLPQVNKSKF